MGVVVVTGGAGFIGSHIADDMISSGHTVHIIDDLSTGVRSNLPANAVFHHYDICNEEAGSLIKSLSPDIVIHTAAQISVRRSMEVPPEDVRVNVQGLVSLLHSCNTVKLPFFVFLSTGGAIYGNQDYFPAKEDHPIRPTSIYGLSKKVGEEYLEFWQREHGLKFAALRLANVYGPRQNPHGEAGVVAIFAKKLFAGETPVINGDGKQTRDFVYVKDVVAAVNAVATKKATGIFNIGTGIETSVNELYKYIKDSSEVSIDAKYGDAKSGEQLRSSIDASKAKSTFGWEAKTKLNEGILETVRSFKE